MSSFQTLPNELTFNIVSRLGIKDVTALSRTCKGLYHYCRSREVSNYLVKSELQSCPEFIRSSDSEQNAVSAEAALRRVVKRREALSEASPFSVAILGFGTFYLYRNKWLWYLHNSDIRGLQVNSGRPESALSTKTEIAIDYREILEKTAFAHQGFQEGSFSLLHFQDGILSCLYRLPAREDPGNPGSESDDSDYEELEPVQPGWLIVLNVSARSIIFHKRLASTKNIFARHANHKKTDTTYLYYGFREHDRFDKRHRWTLDGFKFEKSRPLFYLGTYFYLQDIDGFELGSTVCFEIIDGFFYAVTNQSTYRAQEIDWSSFYHCIRFPIDNICREALEKTEEGSMWRRQHNEGPVDDRWSNLSIARDEKSGSLIIVECRKELSTGKRTAYKTDVVFPEKLVEAETNPDSAKVAAPLKQKTTFKIVLCTPQEEEARKLELLKLTQDRVALTLEDHHTPRFLAPQSRHAANVHAEPANGTFTISTTPARSYNASASCFLDLVNDLPRHDPSVKQCIRLRASTRRPSLPPKDENGIIQFASDDALNYVYADTPVSFWPPPLPAVGQEDYAVRQLHELLNPPGYQGKVTGTFDDTSLVYSIGKEGTEKALVFINFDASLRLPGLRRWDDFRKHGSQVNVLMEASAQLYKGKRVFNDMQPNFETSHNISSVAASTNDFFPQRKKRRSLTTILPVRGRETSHADVVDLTGSADDQGGLFRTEPAFYLSIERGFDFSSSKTCI